MWHSPNTKHPLTSLLKCEFCVWFVLLNTMRSLSGEGRGRGSYHADETLCTVYVPHQSMGRQPEHSYYRKTRIVLSKIIEYIFICSLDVNGHISIILMTSSIVFHSSLSFQSYIVLLFSAIFFFWVIIWFISWNIT